jgi:sulfite reductase alpha subunit-like flavoprotein
MIFVAGSANRMPLDVKRAFRNVVVQQGGLDPADADRFLAAMVKKGHSYVEAWS